VTRQCARRDYLGFRLGLGRRLGFFDCRRASDQSPTSNDGNETK
jgi:hypothetical protein